MWYLRFFLFHIIMIYTCFRLYGLFLAIIVKIVFVGFWFFLIPGFVSVNAQLEVLRRLQVLYLLCYESIGHVFKQIFLFFITKGFRTIVFILIVISTTFRPICPPAFFRCLSNSGTLMELRTTSFIETTGVACSDSVGHNRVQVLSIPVELLACREDWTCNLQMIVSIEA